MSQEMLIFWSATPILLLKREIQIVLGGRATTTDDAAIHTLPFQLGLGEGSVSGTLESSVC